MGKKDDTIALPEAITAISAYNNGVYGKTGRKNIDIDNDARQRFSGGLGETLPEIKGQVRFIGQDYGGTANTLAGQLLPARIGQDIYSVRDEYAARISSALPLINIVPDQKLIELLFQPFEQILESPNGKRVWKNWLTWGTKFWHFLNPDAFPILDSRAKKFFSVTTHVNVLQTYREYMEVYRASMMHHQNWFPRLRQIDGGLAWNDVKLWDKVAYEVGAM